MLAVVCDLDNCIILAQFDAARLAIVLCALIDEQLLVCLAQCHSTMLLFRLREGLIQLCALRTGQGWEC